MSKILNGCDDWDGTQDCNLGYPEQDWVLRRVRPDTVRKVEINQRQLQSRSTEASLWGIETTLSNLPISWNIISFPTSFPVLQRIPESNRLWSNSCFWMISLFTSIRTADNHSFLCNKTPVALLQTLFALDIFFCLRCENEPSAPKPPHLSSNCSNPFNVSHSPADGHVVVCKSCWLRFLCVTKRGRQSSIKDTRASCSPHWSHWATRVLQ